MVESPVQSEPKAPLLPETTLSPLAIHSSSRVHVQHPPVKQLQPPLYVIPATAELALLLKNELANMPVVR